MAQDFTNAASDELRRKIETATDHEALREILKSDLAHKGILMREPDGNFAVAQPVSGNPVRENVFAEPGTPRFTQNLYLELQADSPEQLQAMKQRVYEMFGKGI